MTPFSRLCSKVILSLVMTLSACDDKATRVHTEGQIAQIQRVLSRGEAATVTTMSRAGLPEVCQSAKRWCAAAQVYEQRCIRIYVYLGVATGPGAAPLTPVEKTELTALCAAISRRSDPPPAAATNTVAADASAVGRVPAPPVSDTGAGGGASDRARDAVARGDTRQAPPADAGADHQVAEGSAAGADAAEDHDAASAVALDTTSPADAIAPAGHDTPPPVEPVAADSDAARSDNLPVCPEEPISRFVRRRGGPVRICYERRLEKTPSLRGTLTMGWDVNADGSIANARQLESTLRDGYVADCAARVLSHMRLPAPPGGPCRAKWHFRLAPRPPR